MKIFLRACFFGLSLFSLHNLVAIDEQAKDNTEIVQTQISTPHFSISKMWFGSCPIQLQGLLGYAGVTVPFYFALYEVLKSGNLGLLLRYMTGFSAGFIGAQLAIPVKKMFIKIVHSHPYFNSYGSSTQIEHDSIPFAEQEKNGIKRLYYHVNQIVQSKDEVYARYVMYAAVIACLSCTVFTDINGANYNMLSRLLFALYSGISSRFMFVPKKRIYIKEIG